MPPSLFGHRQVPRRSAAEAAEMAGNRREIHAPRNERNPLPRNVSSVEELPADRGWWGFSFRDVPVRRSGPTALLTFDDVDLVSKREPDGRRDYFPALLDRQGRSLELREVRYRPMHAAAPRRSGRRLLRGTWIAERVYHNHSHWLTAHLPKVVLLRDLDRLHDLTLPAERTPAMDASLRALGIEPERCETVATGERVTFAHATVLETDRFRPDLLMPVRSALAKLGHPRRRVFISRRRARGRRLLEEDALAPMLREHGFERVEMETLNFDAQVRLMGETAVLAAPHGAGLTNMMFCAPGTQVVEIADTGFPNPNFYALASAMGHDYWLVRARGVGNEHPLDQNLSVDAEALRAVLERLPL